MSYDVLKWTIGRISAHARVHEIDAISVILHGGEPLLAGQGYVRRVLEGFRSVETAGLRVDLKMQTNGVLLDDGFLDLFRQYGVKVGVSVDGTAAVHDRHRRHPDGRGSYDQACRALEFLNRSENRPLFSGLLGVIDLDEDPVGYYESMIKFTPPWIDLRLPHATWDVPPPLASASDSRTPYGDWLAEVFNRWYFSPRSETRIRFFESVMRLWLGGTTMSESLGLGSVDLVTVETDGAIEQVDSLKVVGDGAAATGFHVLTNSFDEVLAHPGIAARQGGLEALGAECRACPIVTVCGGGLYTHRYRQGRGFRNPSVYCRDLYRVIIHIRDRMAADVEALRRGAVGVR